MKSKLLKSGFVFAVCCMLSTPFIFTKALTFLQTADVGKNAQVYTNYYDFNVSYSSSLKHSIVMRALNYGDSSQVTMGISLKRKGIFGDTNCGGQAPTMPLVNVQYVFNYGDQKNGKFRYEFLTKASSGFSGEFHGTAELFGV